MKLFIISQFLMVAQLKFENGYVISTQTLTRHVITYQWGANAHALWRDCNSAIVHYNDVIMGVMASQIISLTIVYSTVYSGSDQRKHQSSASLAFVRGIHRWPVNPPHKGPVTRKSFHLMTSSCYFHSEQGKSEGFDSCDRPSNLIQNWIQIVDFLPM